eukprot:CAMPEP_0180657670 /NCGR_PEP_ID=MMETSP1037_2-20121125/56551_1 /TAXON_ID=632150 /ORGANISM="Azadinium spinosum, Strain 3D9" /LENGTH=37 /DNA_ID= /DNA_START= /DNA_END= /DNA_ORIENTATION=
MKTRPEVPCKDRSKLEPPVLSSGDRSTPSKVLASRGA